MEIDLKDRVAVVTGAAQGIGRRIGEVLAAAGAKVSLIDINQEQVEKTAAELGADAYAADVSNFERSAEVLKAIHEKHGAINILINNAGITRDKLLLRMKEEDFEAVINVNLKSAFNFTKNVLPFMLKAGYGRIISISSIIGIIGNAGQANYAASKAGMIGFTKSIAKEVAVKGITVNAIAPGFIETEMTSVLKEEVKEAIRKTIPMGRYGLPDDVANGVLFLASPLAGYITGQVLSVDGGMR